MNIELINEARRVGAKLVLDAIHSSAPATRQSIVKQSGLGLATVDSILTELVAKGLVCDDINKRPDKGKQDPSNNQGDISLRADAHIVAGMKLSDKLVSVVFMNFEGERIGEYIAAPPKPVFSAEEATNFLHATLKEAASIHGLPISGLSAVAVGLPGIVNAEKGIVHWSPGLNKRNLSFQKMLEEKIGIDAYVDNDANLLAVAEQRYGAGRKRKNFIVVTVEQGVGLGIIVNGEIYRGTGGHGAELGHVKVQLDGALCRCGQYGCLEAYVGDYALLRESDTIGLTQCRDTSQDSLSRFLRAIDDGKSQAKLIFRRSNRMLVMGLTSMINILAPELIIISSERLEHCPELFDELVGELNTATMKMGSPPPDVILNKWDVHMWAQGAAAYAVERVAEKAIATPFDGGYLSNNILEEVE